LLPTRRALGELVAGPRLVHATQRSGRDTATGPGPRYKSRPRTPGHAAVRGNAVGAARGGREGQHPTIDCGVIELKAALQEDLLDVAVAERIAQVPGQSLDEGAGLEVPALEVAAGFSLQPEGGGVQDRRPSPERRRQAEPVWLTTREWRRIRVCDAPDRVKPRLCWAGCWQHLLLGRRSSASVRR
jgi:hypothetical protein